MKQLASLLLGKPLKYCVTVVLKNWRFCYTYKWRLSANGLSEAFTYEANDPSLQILRATPSRLSGSMHIWNVCSKPTPENFFSDNRYFTLCYICWTRKTMKTLILKVRFFLLVLHPKHQAVLHSSTLMQKRRTNQGIAYVMSLILAGKPQKEVSYAFFSPQPISFRYIFKTVKKYLECLQKESKDSRWVYSSLAYFDTSGGNLKQYFSAIMQSPLLHVK